MPAIFRVHEVPEESKIQNFLRVAEGILGVKFSFNKVDKFALQKIVKTAEEMGHGPIISYLLLRSMKKAKYSIQNIGHYGLSSDSYVHFTSPIRRYPDLVVHRLLKRAISKKKWTPTDEYMQKLDEIAKLSSQREEISEKAEWELVDLKKYEFMKEKVGEVMQGIVTHLVPQGMFVEIEEFLTEGFIPFSKLKESVSFNEENFEVTLGDKKIRLGDKIMVKILSVNKWAKSMELGLAEA
jgi:ribonuclease R